MKKIVALILALMMIIGCMALVSCAKDETKTTATGEASEKSESAKIKEKGKIVIGVTDYAPYDFQQDDEWVGFDADMAKLLAEKLGVEAEIVEIDWEQKITELKTGKIDLIWNGMTMSDDLAKEMDFSKPYAENSQVVVIKKDNAETIKSAEDLKGKKVAVESGSAGEEAAKENIGEDEVVGLTGQTKALMEVKLGTSDAAVIDYSMAKSLCGTGDYADLMMVEGSNMGEEQFAVGARQGSDLVALINELFAETAESGKMKELQEKYGMNEDGSSSIALCEF